MNIEDKFLDYISANYSVLKGKYRKLCSQQGLTFDDDVFSDTIIKCHSLIAKNGLKDSSDDGIANYFFKSFKTNLLREALYSRVAKRDCNITDDSGLFEAWERHCSTGDTSSLEKVERDLRQDFLVLQVLSEAELLSGSTLAHLFASKFYLGRKYNELVAMHPEVKGLKTKLLSLKNDLKKKLDKEELEKRFLETFEDFLADY